MLRCIILMTITLWSEAKSALPSTTTELLASRDATPDAVYVIGMEQCEERWKRARAWSSRSGIAITPLYGTRFDQIDLRQPPIPVVGIPREHEVMAGQVACTTSHIRAWRHAFSRNFSTVIVLEDDVGLSDYLQHRIPRIMFEAKEGSRLRNGFPWHFIYLRFHPMLPDSTGSKRAWHGQVQIASPGWGTAAYMLSNAGIRFLLTRVTAYSHPLDVQIERLQRGLDTQGAKFVTLHVCDVNFRGNLSAGCPENIVELSPSERGNCFFSASRSGELFKGTDFPGAVQPKTSSMT